MLKFHTVPTIQRGVFSDLRNRRLVFLGSKVLSYTVAYRNA